jgi:hypothetical protein
VVSMLLPAPCPPLTITLVRTRYPTALSTSITAVLKDSPSVKSFNGVRAVCVPVAFPVAVSHIAAAPSTGAPPMQLAAAAASQGGNNHDVSSY